MTADPNDNNDEENNQVALVDYKSSAIVKYDSIQTPTGFNRLHSNIDLNLPPPNWLREEDFHHEKWFESLKAHWAFPGQAPNHSLFSSFHMASNFLDCVGEVDVISDAENIKRLLKIPFNNGAVSMIVHRIGKTLLLDHFDINTHLLRTSQNEWSWLRKFYFDQVLRSFQEKQKILWDQANSCADHRQNNHLFSKFLHYSVAEDMRKVGKKPKKKRNQNKDSNISKNDAQEVSIGLNKSNRTNNCPVGNQPNASRAKQSPQKPRMTQKPTPKEELEDDEFLRGIQDHQRNVIWTFEDIQMLIGSDMPIFGDGSHPAVSLRLRDINKPIKVLTGLDYWLDNLMCNVPEVLMCYHLEGIVQKYERIKTEEIPHIENSKFSPRVVKDIAQNILSFLKTRAARCGHTYWLFKGKNDEAVKLYDLTSLCSDIGEEPNLNPYTAPVAMLLFNVANKVHGGLNDPVLAREFTRTRKAILYKLLNESLSLLDAQKYKRAAICANYLMADVYMPSNSNLTSLEVEIEKNCSVNEAFNVTTQDENDGVLTIENPPTVDASWLSTSRDVKKDVETIHDKLPPILNSDSWEERCDKAYEHLLKALDVLQQDYHFDYDILADPIALYLTKTENKDIYDIYSSVEGHLMDKRQNKKFCAQIGKCDPTEISWKTRINLYIMLKSCQANAIIAKYSSIALKMGKALVALLKSILYIEKCCSLIVKHTIRLNSNYVNEVFKTYYYLFYIAGDVISELAECADNYQEILTYYYDDKNIRNLEGIELEIVYGSMLPFLASIPREYDVASLTYISAKCHRRAATYSGSVDVRKTLNSRLGNVLNVIGTKHMDLMLENMEQDLTKIYGTCHMLLSEAHDIFSKEKDTVNEIMILGNLAKLNRVMGYSSNKSNAGNNQCCYFQTATQKYLEALRLSKSLSDATLSAQLSWDLCTACHQYECYLQKSISHLELDFVYSEMIKTVTTAITYFFVNHEGGGGRMKLCLEKRTAINNQRLAVVRAEVMKRRGVFDKVQIENKTLANRNFEEAASLYFKLNNYQHMVKSMYDNACLEEEFLKVAVGIKYKTEGIDNMINKLLSIPVIVNTEIEEESMGNIRYSEDEDNSDNVLSSKFSSQFPVFPMAGNCYVPQLQKSLWRDDRSKFVVQVMDKYLFAIKSLVKLTNKIESDNLQQKYKELFRSALTARRDTTEEILEILLEHWKIYESPTIVQEKRKEDKVELERMNKTTELERLKKDSKANKQKLKEAQAEATPNSYKKKQKKNKKKKKF